MRNKGFADGDVPDCSGQLDYCSPSTPQPSFATLADELRRKDFCLWGPPAPGSTIGDSEEFEVAWCTAAGHGARLMPPGTITGAHFLITPHYIQVTGVGDFTKMNVQSGDEGGELDPHGQTGLGNPIGSIVLANGTQVLEWTSFMSDTQFCFRVCPNATDAALWCQHQASLDHALRALNVEPDALDLLSTTYKAVIGSLLFRHASPSSPHPDSIPRPQRNEPGSYDVGVFESCHGDGTAYPPGVYEVGGGLSTFLQGQTTSSGSRVSRQGATPAAAPAGASSNCKTVSTVGVVPTPTTSATTPPTPSRPAGVGTATSSPALSSTTNTTTGAAASQTSFDIKHSKALRNEAGPIALVFSLVAHIVLGGV
ncbi:SPOSA6832_05050, partial [Sporobolomyces salmonicolor]